MCERVALEGGGFAIVCGGHRRSNKRCAYPECRRFVEILCDAPDGKGGTCSRGTCRAHAKPLGPDEDHCWKCATAAARQPRLFDTQETR